jgi:hypothetical protein
MTFFNDPNILSTLVIILAILTFVLIGIVIWMYSKMRRFIIGVDSHNIADSLTHVSTNLTDLQEFKNKTEDYLTDVETRLQKSVRSVHTVRFNPFHGTGEGGNQSFATAMLNENGDGVVISSLYSRDRVSVFSKPVKGFVSEYEMSDEEKEAIKKAQEKL